MTREPYEPARVRQLRILVKVVLGLAVVLLVWAGLIVLGNGAVDVAVRILVLPGVLLGAFAVVALRALAIDSAAAKVPLVATAIITIVEALLLSRTVVGLLAGVVGVALLLFAVLPGRGEPAEPADG